MLLIAQMSCQQMLRSGEEKSSCMKTFQMKKNNLENFVSQVVDVKGLSNRSKGFDEMFKINRKLFAFPDVLLDQKTFSP